jgi:hypothetical protein
MRCTNARSAWKVTFNAYQLCHTVQREGNAVILLKLLLLINCYLRRRVAADERRRAFWHLFQFTIFVDSLSPIPPSKRTDDPTKGLRFIDSLLASENRFRMLEALRTTKDVFNHLLELLHKDIPITLGLPAHLQLAIFLDWVGQGTTFRQQYETWGKSKDTIAKAM